MSRPLFGWKWWNGVAAAVIVSVAAALALLLHMDRNKPKIDPTCYVTRQDGFVIFQSQDSECDALIREWAERYVQRAKGIEQWLRSNPGMERYIGVPPRERFEWDPMRPE